MPRRYPAREGKRAISFFVEPEKLKRLRVIAILDDTSLQDLLREAVERLLDKRGCPSLPTRKD